MTQTNQPSSEPKRVHYDQVVIGLLLIGLISAVVTMAVNFHSNQAEMRSRFEERTVSADARIKQLTEEFNRSRDLLSQELRVDRTKLSDLRATVLRFDPYIDQLNAFTQDSLLQQEIAIDLRRSVERLTDRLTQLEVARGEQQAILQQLNVLQGLIQRHIASSVKHVIALPPSANTPQHISP